MKNGILLYLVSLTSILVFFMPSLPVNAQTYWYCWDYGAPAPHHLGHPVSGDHYCTADELSGGGGPTGPTPAEQGQSNGTDDANSTNREYITSAGTTEGTTDGTDDGNTNEPLGESSDAATFCAKEPSFSTPQPEEYISAYKASYLSACQTIYNNAYSAAYYNANNVAAKNKAQEDAKRDKSSNVLWYLVGGGVVFYIVSALYLQNKKTIDKWFLD